MYVFNDLDVSVWMFRTFLTQCLQVVDDYIFCCCRYNLHLWTTRVHLSCSYSW